MPGKNGVRRSTRLKRAQSEDTQDESPLRSLPAPTRKPRGRKRSGTADSQASDKSTATALTAEPDDHPKIETIPEESASILLHDHLQATSQDTASTNTSDTIVPESSFHAIDTSNHENNSDIPPTTDIDTEDTATVVVDSRKNSFSNATSSLEVPASPSKASSDTIIPVNTSNNDGTDSFSLSKEKDVPNVDSSALNNELDDNHEPTETSEPTDIDGLINTHEPTKTDEPADIDGLTNTHEPLDIDVPTDIDGLTNTHESIQTDDPTDINGSTNTHEPLDIDIPTTIGEQPAGIDDSTNVDDYTINIETPTRINESSNSYTQPEADPTTDVEDPITFEKSINIETSSGDKIEGKDYQKEDNYNHKNDNNASGHKYIPATDEVQDASDGEIQDSIYTFRDFAEIIEPHKKLTFENAVTSLQPNQLRYDVGARYKLRTLFEAMTDAEKAELVVGQLAKITELNSEVETLKSTVDRQTKLLGEAETVIDQLEVEAADADAQPHFDIEEVDQPKIMSEQAKTWHDSFRRKFPSVYGLSGDNGSRYTYQALSPITESLEGTPGAAAQEQVDKEKEGKARFFRIQFDSLFKIFGRKRKASEDEDEDGDDEASARKKPKITLSGRTGPQSKRFAHGNSEKSRKYTRSFDKSPRYFGDHYRMRTSESSGPGQSTPGAFPSSSETPDRPYSAPPGRRSIDEADIPIPSIEKEGNFLDNAVDAQSPSYQREKKTQAAEGGSAIGKLQYVSNESSSLKRTRPDSLFYNEDENWYLPNKKRARKRRISPIPSGPSGTFSFIGAYFEQSSSEEESDAVILSVIETPKSGVKRGAAPSPTPSEKHAASEYRGRLFAVPETPASAASSVPDTTPGNIFAETQKNYDVKMPQELIETLKQSKEAGMWTGSKTKELARLAGLEKTPGFFGVPDDSESEGSSLISLDMNTPSPNVTSTAVHQSAAESPISPSVTRSALKAGSMKDGATTNTETSVATEIASPQAVSSPTALFHGSVDTEKADNNNNEDSQALVKARSVAEKYKPKKPSQLRTASGPVTSNTSAEPEVQAQIATPSYKRRAKALFETPRADTHHLRAITPSFGSAEPETITHLGSSPYASFSPLQPTPTLDRNENFQHGSDNFTLAQETWAFGAHPVDFDSEDPYKDFVWPEALPSFQSPLTAEEEKEWNEWSADDGNLDDNFDRMMKAFMDTVTAYETGNTAPAVI